MILTIELLEKKTFIKILKLFFMAHHSEGEIGGIRGRVGTMVVSEWKGIPVVKRSPRSKPNRKISQKQLVQRAKFKLASQFFRRFTDLFSSTFQEVLGQSGRTLAFQETLKKAITGTYPDFTIDYSKVLVAQGRLQKSLNAYVEAETGALRFHWSSDLLPGQDPFDNSILVVFCPEVDSLYYTLIGAPRSAATSLLNVPFYAGREVHTWLSFRSPDGEYKADSVYTGTVMVG
jgi:hypothetical protein